MAHSSLSSHRTLDTHINTHLPSRPHKHGQKEQEPPRAPLSSPCPSQAPGAIETGNRGSRGRPGSRVRPRAAQLDARLGGVEDFGPNGGKVAANTAGGRK